MDAAKAHYDGVLSADPKPLTIEEWGGTFYVRPQISVKKKMEIQAKLTGDKMDEGLGAFVDLLPGRRLKATPALKKPTFSRCADRSIPTC